MAYRPTDDPSGRVRPPEPGDAAFVRALRADLARQTGERVEDVALRVTHLSWVFLAGDRAWKVKRPVRLPFVDFSTPALREAACREELRLNRRLAPELYLDVVPILGDREAPRWSGDGPACDHAVHMRRFDERALMSHRVADGRATPQDVDRLAARLGAFHRDAAPCVAANGALVPPARTAANLVAQVLGTAPGDPADAALRAWIEAASDRLGPCFADRLARGAVRDGHGDLHLGNLVVLDGAATAFDALEFDPGLRCIDRMADIAFATMDLAARGRPDLAARLLDGWLAVTGDFDGLRVLRFHEACRALVRALVARLSPPDPAVPPVPDYLAFARSLAAAPPAPRLLITHGLSGAGKSVLAAALVEAAGAVRVRSDVERKRLAGLEATASSRASGASLYDAATSRRTYDRMAAAVEAALDGGLPAVADATFLRRDERDRFRALARTRGVPFRILDCRAPMALLRERVEGRLASRRDASEADLAVLAAQARRAEPLGDDERAWTLVADAAAPPDIAALARDWLAAGPGAPAAVGAAPAAPHGGGEDRAAMP